MHPGIYEPPGPTGPTGPNRPEVFKILLVLKRVRDLEIVLGPGPVPGFDIFLGPELTGFGPWIPVCIGVTKPGNWKITTSA